jgi:hypothetical protein
LVFTTPGAVVFAVMFTLESLARACSSTPLQAYELLGDKADQRTQVSVPPRSASASPSDLIRVSAAAGSIPWAWS